MTIAIGKRQALIFAAGLALGLGGAWLAFSDGPAGSGGSDAAAPAARVGKAPAPSPAGPASAAATATSGAGCPAQTATALSDAKDGQFQLQADLSGKSDKDIGAFIVVGKEAAAAGRARDAEIAFLMSCRVAEQQKGGDSLPAADAKYQLAWHYANLGLHGGGANRAELLRRAERLYADSLEIYKARQGPTHEKTRFAAEGLAALRQPAAEPGRAAVAQAPTRPAAPVAAPTPAPAAAAPPQRQAQPSAAAAAPASPRAQPPATAARSQLPAPTTPAPATARAATPAPAQAPAVARAPSPPQAPAVTARAPTPPPAARPERPAPARAPTQATMGAPAQAQGSATVLAPPTPRVAAAQGSATAGGDAGAPVRASFDCAKARSRSERIICSDAELARQDRELGRLYARARDAAPDSGAFRRHSDQEWRRREATCEDRECLLRWYAQRRSQLNAELGEAR